MPSRSRRTVAPNKDDQDEYGLRGLGARDIGTSSHYEQPES
jgi:hypothetical protein